MEKDIFITRPCLPPNDPAAALSSSVSRSAGNTLSNLNERQRSTNGGERVYTHFLRITTIEAAHYESVSSNDNKSGQAIGKEKSGTVNRAKRNLNEPYSSKNGEERAFASSSFNCIATYEELIAESPPRPRITPPKPSIDNVVSSSARRSIGTLNELHSSKTDGERACASSPYIKPSTIVEKIAEAPLVRQNQQLTPEFDSYISNSATRPVEMSSKLRSPKTEGEGAVTSSTHMKPSTVQEKIAVSQYQQPHNNPATSASSSATDLGLRCCVDKSKERHSSTFDRELAFASTLSKEFYCFYRVSHLPLSECQLVCHYKSWLFQARNYVRWRSLFWVL